MWTVRPTGRARRQSALPMPVQHLDGVRWEASMQTWLHRVAANECRMLRGAGSSPDIGMNTNRTP